MGLNFSRRSYHAEGYEDEYESTNYVPEEEKTFKLTQMRRLRKNPLMVKPCLDPSQCDYMDFLQFRDWMSKEWLVYQHEIVLVQEDIGRCREHTDRINMPAKSCGPLINHYFELLTEQNQTAAKRYLATGKPLVDEDGFVFKYGDTEEGQMALLKKYFDLVKQAQKNQEIYKINKKEAQEAIDKDL